MQKPYVDYYNKFNWTAHNLQTIQFVGTTSVLLLLTSDTLLILLQWGIYAATRCQIEICMVIYKSKAFLMIKTFTKFQWQ